MIVDSRQSLHFGVNLILSPPPILDGRSLRRYQEALASQGLEFDRTRTADGTLGGFIRSSPKPLEVRVQLLGPQAPLAQLLMIAPHPERPLDMFKEDCQLACDAFVACWGQPAQIVKRDCTIRHLYDVGTTHAFQYLWEGRLGKSEQDLAALQRPVLGGGLRLVCPSIGTDPDSAQIEVKIESYLKDSRKLFVEVGFAWPHPSQPGSGFSPGTMLDQVEAYSTIQVVDFITGGD